jgi:RHH-type proline utilization regulon transcriptional repressor/proline dehydrogenase/delta 1-pyrroline-5-carboxylate dehydrogenase
MRRRSRAIAGAHASGHAWDRLGGPSAHLDRAADLYERDRVRLMAVMVREAGKTVENAQGDVREAVDFLRYYAAQARRLFAGPVSLRGPTGETNLLELRGRGPFACISPWNFPLAIFTGQVAAALAAGNPVLAKPAEQTPIIAFLAVQLLRQGVPPQRPAAAARHRRRRCGLVKDPRVAASPSPAPTRRVGHPAALRRPARRHRAFHRRDRRPQRHDRRLGARCPSR